MPRDRKGQPPQVPNAQAYGMRNELMEAQKQIPIPEQSLTPDVNPNVQPPPDPQEGWQQMLEQIQALPQMRGNALRAPTNRPREPLTTGLNGGPGAGPEALARFRRPPVKMKAEQVLNRVAQATGNPKYAGLAQRARR